MIKKTLKDIRAKVKRLTQTEQEKRHALVGPAHLWKMKQDFQIQFLKNQGLQPPHKLLDIGCGTLRGGIPIIDYIEQGNYFGIDVRPEVIEEGKKELNAHQLAHKEPTILSFNEFSDLNFEVKFNFIFAFSVLIHLEDKIALNCFKMVSECLDNNGVFYANVNIAAHRDGIWQGFPVVFRSIGFYEEMASQFGLTVKNIGVLGDLGHVSSQGLADDQIMLEIRKSA